MRRLEVIGQKHSKTAILAKNGQILALTLPDMRGAVLAPLFF